MTKKVTVLTLGAIFLRFVFPPLRGQKTGKVARIGYLDGTNFSASADRFEAFQQELGKPCCNGFAIQIYRTPL
jgi:hypothetical protein